MCSLRPRLSKTIQLSVGNLISYVRTKEEMVLLSGEPLYPKRISDTLGFRLSQGPVSEQVLYNETTDYMRHVYNRAKLLNRSAARLAMSVMQRRLASSTYALTRSFERRIEKLDELIRRVQENNLTGEEINLLQRRTGGRTRRHLRFENRGRRTIDWRSRRERGGRRQALVGSDSDIAY